MPTMPGMKMMMPGQADGNDFALGGRFTNRLGERRSMPALVVPGGILATRSRVSFVDKVGSFSRTISKVGGG